MKRLTFAVCLMAAAALLAAQTLPEIFKSVDELYDNTKNPETFDLLNGALAKASSNTDKAEVYWRFSRYYESLGKNAKDDGKTAQIIQDYHTKGEEYADKAIAADARSYLAYYWKSANIGRWAESKGILDSLFKATPMRDAILTAISINPEHPGSYNVLCQLYYKAPGVISFGNPDTAVNYGRYGVMLNKKEAAAGIDELNYDASCELGAALWARNWDASKRNAEQAKKKKTLETGKLTAPKPAFYEGSISIEALSDRDEAKKIVRWVISEIEAKAAKTVNEGKDLAKAKRFLTEWTK